MSLKYITTEFSYLFTKQMGNLKIIVSKAKEDEVFKIETRRIHPPFDNHSLLSIEFMTKEKFEKKKF